MKLDRLARALAPYAGVLTVSTCGAPPDCEEPGDHKTVNVQASVTGSVALDSSQDGRIDAALTRGGDPAAAVWRCEASVLASGGRATSDESTIVPMTGSAQVSCSIGDGRITTRVLSFTVPLEDLRTMKTAKLPAAMDVNVQAVAAPESSCNAKLDVTLDVDASRSAGASTPGPRHVTADFVRDLAITIRLGGQTRSVTTERPCVFRLDGTISLDAHVDQASVRETDTPTCL